MGAAGASARDHTSRRGSDAPAVHVRTPRKGPSTTGAHRHHGEIPGGAGERSATGKAAGGIYGAARELGDTSAAECTAATPSAAAIANATAATAAIHNGDNNDDIASAESDNGQSANTAATVANAFDCTTIAAFTTTAASNIALEVTISAVATVAVAACEREPNTSAAAPTPAAV